MASLGRKREYVARLSMRTLRRAPQPPISHPGGYVRRRPCQKSSANYREISISNNVGGVKHVSSTLLYALMEERHFALGDGLRVSNQGLALNRSGQELGPTQPSLRSLTAIKIHFFGLPHLLGAGCPIITSVFDRTPSRFPGSPACEPSLCIWP